MPFSTGASSDRAGGGRLGPLVRRALSFRPLRFLLVGGLNTLFGYGLFTVLYLGSHRRQVSLVAATAIGALFNFFTTGRLVFADRGYRMLIPFILGYGLVLGANMALLETLTRVGLSALAAQAIAMPVVVVASYLTNRYFVFVGASRESAN